MSYMESYEGFNPDGVKAVMCHIYVDSQSILRLSSCVPYSGTYTLQFWIKSTDSSEVFIETDGLHKSIQSTAAWTKYIFTFTASEDTDGAVYLNLPVGVYYLYHVKIEMGNVATDWTARPDSDESQGVAGEESKLYRLSDKYADKIGCDNGLWYIERNTELLTFDGTEAWTHSDNTHTLTLPLRGNAYETLPVRCEAYDNVTLVNTDTESVLTVTSDSFTSEFSVLVPAQAVTVKLANYLQNTLNNIKSNGTLSVKFVDDTVHSMSGCVLVKPIVLGKVNVGMSALINNGSDGDIGFIYQIHCTDKVVNPTIYHSETNQHIRLNATFKKDDIITIDTRRGNKSVTKSYKGIDTNIINSLDNTSKWLQLQTGYNRIIQAADEGAPYMDSVIIYTNEYEGV